MRDSLKRVGVLAGRALKEIGRDPLSLIFLFAMPLVMEVGFYFLFHDQTDQFHMDQLAPGIVVFSQAFLTLFAGLLLATDRGTAFLTRLFVTRAKPAEFIFGYVLALIPLVLLQSVLFFAVGAVIDRGILGWGMVSAVLFSLVTSLLFLSLGLLIGSLCREKSVGGVASIVIVGQSVLSGMWFPATGLNGGFVTVMRCLPFKNASDLVAHALNGASDPLRDLWIPLFVVLGYTVLAALAAVLAFRRQMRADG
ncbi:MAG: ABC transporter permease [Clostridia bacterium]|nr:ABC transporter permease [Clostridia bacterium]